MNVNTFFTRWLRNLKLESQDDGQVPIAVPYWKSYIEMFTLAQGGSDTSAGWGMPILSSPGLFTNIWGFARFGRELSHNDMLDGPYSKVS